MTQIVPSGTPEERAKAAARAAELLRADIVVAHGNRRWTWAMRWQ
jgi:hypothetical protein